MIYIQGRPAHTLTRSISWATSPQTHTGLFSRVTYPHMFILVYFQGRPAHTLTRSIFMGDLPSLILVYFHGDLPTHVHHGLFSGATDPHTHTVYFHGRPAHKCSSWFIFRGDQPTHSHWSIFMGDLPSHSHWSIFTGDLPTHVHPGLFSGATGPHTHTVYFHERPTHKCLSCWQGLNLLLASVFFFFFLKIS